MNIEVNEARCHVTCSKVAWHETAQVPSSERAFEEVGHRDLREILALPAGGVQRGSWHPFGGHESRRGSEIQAAIGHLEFFFFFFFFFIIIMTFQ